MTRLFSAKAEQIRTGQHSKELQSRAECKSLGRVLQLRLLGHNDNFFKINAVVLLPFLLFLYKPTMLISVS